MPIHAPAPSAVAAMRYPIQMSDPNANAMPAISSARWPRPYEGLGGAVFSMRGLFYRKFARRAGLTQVQLYLVGGGAAAKQNENALFGHHAVGAGAQRRDVIVDVARLRGRPSQDVIGVVGAVVQRVGVLPAGDVRDQHLGRGDAGVGWDLVDQRVKVRVAQAV